jgi:hypothetical protein
MNGATAIATSNGRARWPISTGYACRLAAPVLDETAYSLQLELFVPIGRAYDVVARGHDRLSRKSQVLPLLMKLGSRGEHSFGRVNE